ncbi:MAG: hypothetical protein B7X93_03970 [Hydrogenophilales bacterium 17-61-9]|nr:MAG: hypothetical protein B7X93_03970 [Hydrogenophilales bacterium 17-61-9]
METTTNFLPVVSTIKSAANRLWDARKSLLWLLVLAGLASGFLDWIVFASSENIMRKSFLVGAAQALVYTVLAVRVHRLVLCAENAEQGLVRWTGRETRFLGWLVVVYCYLVLIFALLALLMGAVGVMALLPQAGWWWGATLMFLASLPAAYLFVRLSVLLPATAVDQRRTIAWAWALTEGNGWRLVIVLWLVPILLSTLLPVLEVSSLLGWLAWDLFMAALTSFEIAILSVAFKSLGGFYEEQEALAAA